MSRQLAFETWLGGIAPQHQLEVHSLRLATADASFRRYFALNTTRGDRRIVMDAPPDKENSAPFAHVSEVMLAAGLHAPQVLEWDRTCGFLLLTDLGEQTFMQGICERLALATPSAHPFEPGFDALPAPDTHTQNGFMQAIDLLVAWQLASRPGVLPDYTPQLLTNEMQLYPEWYLQRHKGLSPEQCAPLQAVFERIAASNALAPKVFVHCDFMPRNLMLPQNPAGPMGVLDFQDALYGPITYDIASLMRDAFLTWQEPFVIDMTVRYWERAKKAGLITDGDWGDWTSDFGAFYRAVDYMALQRHLRIAGVFARLTLRDGKPRYLADAPRFVAYIRATASRYRELKPLLRVLEAADGADADTRFLRRFGL